jgi:hypothetical protein
MRMNPQCNSDYRQGYANARGIYLTLRIHSNSASIHFSLIS